MSGGGGYFLCFRPHHGVRARRGDQTIEVSIRFGCLQLTPLPPDGGYRPIDPGPLRKVLGPIIERETGLRFHPAETIEETDRWLPVLADQPGAPR